jgi:hypothetical protein
MTAPVDVLAENVEVRLWDSQWVNVVNHADCYRDMDKEEAIATAVRMTERLMAENITKGFPPCAYNRAAVADLIEALSFYTSVCGNTCAMVSRETAAEMYAKGTTALARVGGAS